MAIPKVSPLQPKVDKGSKAGGKEFVDKYEMASRYIYHVLKIMNGTCSLKNRYLSLYMNIFYCQKIYKSLNNKNLFFYFFLSVVSMIRILFLYSNCTSFEGRTNPIRMHKHNVNDMIYKHEIEQVLRQRNPNKYAGCSEGSAPARFETVLQCQVVVNDFRWLWRAEELNLIQTSRDPDSVKSYETKYENVKPGTLIKMMWGQIEHFLDDQTENDILKIVRDSYKRLVNEDFRHVYKTENIIQLLRIRGYSYFNIDNGNDFCRVFGPELFNDLKTKNWLVTKNRGPIHPHPVTVVRKPVKGNCGNHKQQKRKIENTKQKHKQTTETTIYAVRRDIFYQIAQLQTSERKFW